MCEHAVGEEHTMLPTSGVYFPEAVPWMFVNRMSDIVSEDCVGSADLYFGWIGSRETYRILIT
jgi:hypothetical protein